MPKYIDAEKIPYYIAAADDTDPKGRKIAFKSEIDKIPAADVRPERQAHWERVPLKSKYEMVKCSICGWGHGIVAASDMIFCDHCGAKMDGKDGESNG